MSNADQYIKVSIETHDSARKDLLMGILTQAGFEGFEEEPQVLKAYIACDDFDAASISRVLSGLQLTFTVETLQPVNWNAEWEKNFQPITVAAFCAVRASFHKPVADVEHDLIITPKMSFGTGHHATTFLMLQQMSGLRFADLNVLDFGTGTGVLAILAEKLGAAQILALDNDAWSIANAIENIEVNGCSRISIRQADIIAGELEFHVILANINRNVLLAQLESISQHLHKQGVLLMSGLLTGDRPLIESRASEVNLAITDEKERDGWIMLQLTHK
jgi:ribosomal protein L11 methyltransferase